MCGIAGYMGQGDKKTLEKMLVATSHRGPDARGTFVEKNIGLGLNRLAVIDLSPNAKQPMFDDEKTIGIVFNGEIYNYRELKKELKEYKFKSSSDTEVLLYAYKKWGINCLKKLNGMFGFVIYDKKKNLLFGARDRLGEKPLKYYLDNDIFAFASEIKGLLPVLNSRPSLDPIAIHHYLTLQYIPAPYTGFKNIHKLPPAHYFIYKNKKLIIKKYWDLSFEKKLKFSENEWEEILYNKLTESIQSRLISDVPLGVFLSGGVDSASVVALMSQTSKKIKTFSIGFADKRFDESEYALQVAQQYGTDHKKFTVTNKMMGEIFTQLSDYYDEPFADNSAIPMFLLSKSARKYVTVALTGDGGDENFAGYERYNIVAFSDIYKRIPKSLRAVLRQGALFGDKMSRTKFTDRVHTYADTFNKPFFNRYLYYSAFFKGKEKEMLYTKEFKDFVKNNDTFKFFKKNYNPKLAEIDNALQFDISSYLPEDLLFKSDIASMANSLELRAPYLNHELLELTAQMPDDLKIKFFNKKYIFKKILLKNGLLPKKIINRKKRGFVTPIDKWLKEEYKDLVMGKLTSQKFKNASIFQEHKLQSYLNNYFENKNISSNNIFALLALSSWIEKYI